MSENQIKLWKDLIKLTQCGSHPYFDKLKKYVRFYKSSSISPIDIDADNIRTSSLLQAGRGSSEFFLEDKFSMGLSLISLDLSFTYLRFISAK